MVLLAGDKSMTEMHLGQSATLGKPGFINRGSRNTSQNKLDKACFQHDMAYGDFKYFPRGRASYVISHFNC